MKSIQVPFASAEKLEQQFLEQKIGEALLFEFEDVTKFEKEWEALLKNYKAGLDDNLLSSLSQGSNRAQFNSKKVMGEFNVLGSNHIQSDDKRVFEDFNVLGSNHIRSDDKRVFEDFNVLSRFAKTINNQREDKKLQQNQYKIFPQNRAQHSAK
ncbi:hypothetical protein RJ640_029722 [Escallonia rubra]|uniref:Uncharacterized protein n=1 Tax=Escallonia rubra TaxID=112253 RepID=A0AA88RCF6_9ASTE|nr:hypothetical protein RJ640_029722 [Escallonia rubra]